METATVYSVITTARNGTNGTGHAKTREELIAALMREEGKAEIIDGRVVLFMATGQKPGYASDAILVELWMHVKANKLPGIAVGDNKGFLCDLPHRESFSPDAAYYNGAPSGMKFMPTPPVFAVEVRLEGDYGATAEREMEDKRADYFVTGATEVVWDVDLLSPTAIVRKFTKTGGAVTPVAVFKRGDIADAEPTAPGFSMSVGDLFG